MIEKKCVSVQHVYCPIAHLIFMSKSNRVIVNLSGKKIGTSFVFQLFRDNFTSRNSREIFVPGLKEYYFFPIKTANYRLLPERLIGYVYATPETFNRDDLVFMLSILAFEISGFTEKYFSFQAPEGEIKQMEEMKKSIHLCFERFHYLHRYTRASHKSIYISDTNFQSYILSSDPCFQKLIITTLNETTGPTKFFCIMRDPKASIISLLKTGPEHLVTISEEIIKYHVDRYNQFKQLKKLLANCSPLISSILLLDFDYLTKDTANAFKLLCDFLELPNNGNFVIPENPNPSKELPKEYQDNLTKCMPFIDEQINKQIDTSDYKKLSEKKFAILKHKK